MFTNQNHQLSFGSISHRVPWVVSGGKAQKGASSRVGAPWDSRILWHYDDKEHCSLQRGPQHQLPTLFDQIQWEHLHRLGLNPEKPCSPLTRLLTKTPFSSSLQWNWLLTGKRFSQLCLEYGVLWVTSETYWRYKTLWKGDNLSNKFHEVQLNIGTNKTRGLLETTCGLEHWDFPLWWGADALGGGLSGLRSPVSGLKADNGYLVGMRDYLWLVFPK